LARRTGGTVMFPKPIALDYKAKSLRRIASDMETWWAADLQPPA
jgi:hypothetical protein